MTGRTGGFLGAALHVGGQQALHPVGFPLHLLQEGGNSRLGISWGKLVRELGFIERFAMKIVVRVCMLPGRLEVWAPYSSGWVGGFQLLWTMQTMPRPFPWEKRCVMPPHPWVLTINVQGVSSAVSGGEAQGPWLCVWSNLFPALLCLAWRNKSRSVTLGKPDFAQMYVCVFKPIFLGSRLQKISPKQQKTLEKCKEIKSQSIH